MTNDKRDKQAATLDALYHQRGLDAAEEAVKRPPTAEEQAAIDRLDGQARALIRDQRRKALEAAQAETTPAPARPIPGRILAMARDAIVARLRNLAEAEPTLAVQFRHLDELSLRDLQRLLADIEEHAGTPEADEP